MKKRLIIKDMDISAYINSIINEDSVCYLLLLLFSVLGELIFPIYLVK